LAQHPTPVFRGRIEHGRIRLERREDFAGLIARLDGREIDLILRKHRNVRSLSQNAYYWGVVIPLLAEHIGDDTEAVHRALGNEFLQRHIEVETQASWKRLTTVRSTADLDTAEFTEYIEQCRRLGAEMGVVIPSPGYAE
jgi:hypothetical protein